MGRPVDGVEPPPVEEELFASGPITTSANGETIEYLDIASDGTGITVNHNDVTIQKCRVTFNGSGAGAPGITATSRTGLVIEDIEVINGTVPDHGPLPSSDNICVKLSGCAGAQVSRATLRQGSTGIYALSSDNLVFRDIEGHDFRGPMPAGQIIQLDKCAGADIDRVSCEVIPGTSRAEDNLSFYSTPNVNLVNVRIPFGTSSPSGVGIMFEQGDGARPDGARLNNIELEYTGNGALSFYNANDCEATNLRVKKTLPYSTQGPALSDSGNGNLLFACDDNSYDPEDPVQVAARRILFSGSYFAPETSNISFDFNQIVYSGTPGDGLQVVEEDWTPSVPLVRNAFFWRDTSLVPTVVLAPRIANLSDPPAQGETAYILLGKYANDPTSRAWQWYRDGAPISGATDMGYTLQAADVGAQITVGETPTNAAGAGAESVSTATAAVEAATLPNMLSASNDLSDSAWTGSAVRVAGVVADDGQVLCTMTSAGGGYQLARRNAWPNFAGGLPYTLTFSAFAGTHPYIGARIADGNSSGRYVTFDLTNETVNYQGTSGVTAGFYTDSYGDRRCYYTYTPPAGNQIVDLAIVPADGGEGTSLDAGLSVVVGKVKLAQTDTPDDWIPSEEVVAPTVAALLSPTSGESGDTYTVSATISGAWWLRRQWELDGVELAGETGETCVPGANGDLTCVVTVENSAGTVSDETDAAIVGAEPLANLIGDGDTVDSWGGNLTKLGGQTAPSGQTLVLLTTNNASNQNVQRPSWYNFDGSTYTLSLSAEPGNYQYLSIRIGNYGSVSGRNVTFDLTNKTVNFQVAGGTVDDAGFYVDSDGNDRIYFTATPAAGTHFIRFNIVPADGAEATVMDAGLTVYAGKVKLVQGTVYDDWVDG